MDGTTGYQIAYLGIEALLAITAIVALIIAARQLSALRRDLRRQVEVGRVDTYFRVASSCRELQAFFVDRPQLRAYFYDGKEIPRNRLLATKLDATSEMIVDLAESIIACRSTLADLGDDWHKFFAFLYQNSPALREYMRRSGAYYPTEVVSAFIDPRSMPEITAGA